MAEGVPAMVDDGCGFVGGGATTIPGGKLAFRVDAAEAAEGLDVPRSLISGAPVAPGLPSGPTANSPERLPRGTSTGALTSAGFTLSAIICFAAADEVIPGCMDGGGGTGAGAPLSAASCRAAAPPAGRRAFSIAGGGCTTPALGINECQQIQFCLIDGRRRRNNRGIAQIDVALIELGRI